MLMEKYKPRNAVYVKKRRILSFLYTVWVLFEGISFKMFGLMSKDSVMVVPFRRNGKQWEVGFILEERPLFIEGWLSAFPAGKIEPGQTPEDAAKLESLQEAKATVQQLIPIGRPEMPFLHLCNEEVYLFVAIVEEPEDVDFDLEEGEFISESGIHWMPWTEFKNAIQNQEFSGKDFYPDAPMNGVSLGQAYKLLALDFDPETAF